MSNTARTPYRRKKRQKEKRHRTTVCRVTRNDTFVTVPPAAIHRQQDGHCGQVYTLSRLYFAAEDDIIYRRWQVNAYYSGGGCVLYTVWR